MRIYHRGHLTGYFKGGLHTELDHRVTKLNPLLSCVSFIALVRSRRFVSIVVHLLVASAPFPGEDVVVIIAPEIEHCKIALQSNCSMNL